MFICKDNNVAHLRALIFVIGKRSIYKNKQFYGREVNYFETKTAAVYDLTATIFICWKEQYPCYLVLLIEQQSNNQM